MFVSALRNIRFLFFSRTSIDQDSFFFLAYDKSEFVAIRLLYTSFFTHFQWKYVLIAKKRPDFGVMRAHTAGFCCRMRPRRLGWWEAAPRITFAFTPAQFYGIAGSNQIWCAVSPAGRGQWKVRDERARHFLNDLVVAAMGLNGACVIALQGNTARNAREGRIIKTSATDRLLMPFFLIMWRATIWLPCTLVLLNICHIE